MAVKKVKPVSNVSSLDNAHKPKSTKTGKVSMSSTLSKRKKNR